MSTLARPTRAFVLDASGGPEVLQLAERKTVPPGPGELLIDVEVSGRLRRPRALERRTYP